MKVLVRLAAEMAIKSDRIRARFLSRLIRNIQEALSSQGIRCYIKNQWTRLLIEVQDVDDSTQNGVISRNLSDILKRVFGISSFSIVTHECSADFNEIVKNGHEIYKENVRGRKFQVRSRRAGDKYPFTSIDINVALGDMLRKSGGIVDLTHPEVTVYLEIRQDRTYFFGEEIKGAGGYPLGVGGLAIALSSGGFDSVIAAWLVQKRGVAVDHVFCNLSDSAYEKSVLNVLKYLVEQWSYGSNPHVHIVDFKPIAQELYKKVRPSRLQVVLKRFFYRAAEMVAERMKADALITGEAIGQVSSQTIQNLRAIDQVSSLPVFRPVIGMDKDEIFAFARRIGTYELSSVIKEVCSLTTTPPVTECTEAFAIEEESKCDLSILEKVVNERKIINLRNLSLHDLIDDEISIPTVPQDAVVIDCRSEEDFAKGHYPGSQNILFRDLLLDSKLELPKEKTYVLYCPLGLKSAVAAQKLRKNGYEAYSLRGGFLGVQKNVGTPIASEISSFT